MKYINLTQHAATPEQEAAGVLPRTPEQEARIRALLTFDTLPSSREIRKRARALAALARELEEGAGTILVMTGGAPYLMSHLENELINAGMNPRYAFSTRDSVEQVLPGGSTRKVTVFRHLGFVGTDSWAIFHGQ